MCGNFSTRLEGKGKNEELKISTLSDQEGGLFVGGGFIRGNTVFSKLSSSEYYYHSFYNFIFKLFFFRSMSPGISSDAWSSTAAGHLEEYSGSSFLLRQQQQ